MPAPESLPSLTEKLGATLATRRQVEEIYAAAVPYGLRLVYRGCDALPLGLIPASLLWCCVIFFIPAADPLRLILVFALGLLTLLGALGVLFVFRWVGDRSRLDEEILRELVGQDFAYHPTAVLRRALLRQGHVTYRDFRTWVQNERTILNNRANDYVASLEALRQRPPVAHAFSPAARAFLDDR